MEDIPLPRDCRPPATHDFATEQRNFFAVKGNRVQRIPSLTKSERPSDPHASAFWRLKNEIPVFGSPPNKSKIHPSPQSRLSRERERSASKLSAGRRSGRLLGVSGLVR